MCDADVLLCDACLDKMRQPDDGRSSKVTERQEGFTTGSISYNHAVHEGAYGSLADGFAMLEGFTSAEDKRRTEKND